MFATPLTKARRRGLRVACITLWLDSSWVFFERGGRCVFFVYSVLIARSSSIHYLHNPIIHLYCLPKLLHNHCLQFLLGHENVPREVENNAYADLWGVKEVYYGICASSEYKICISKDYSHCLGFCLVRFKSGVVVFVSIFSK